MRLLRSLEAQQTDGKFTISIVICDNDKLQSAKSTIEQFAGSSSVPIRYFVEPRQNIALARNKALANAQGDLVACMDDDEFAPDDWLLTLLRVCQSTGADGVIGPVKPLFDDATPKWVVRSRLYERSTYPSGPLRDWRRGRVNNILFKRDILSSVAEPFNPKFRTGEDYDFIRRMMENGRTFFWCNEAAVSEEIPAVRWRRTFVFRRHMLQGATAAGHPGSGGWDIMKSVVAVFTYLIVVPAAFILGQDKFMVVMAKLSWHLGKVLAALGVNLISDAYVVE